MHDLVVAREARGRTTESVEVAPGGDDGLFGRGPWGWGRVGARPEVARWAEHVAGAVLDCGAAWGAKYKGGGVSSRL